MKQEHILMDDLTLEKEPTTQMTAGGFNDFIPDGLDGAVDASHSDGGDLGGGELDGDDLDGDDLSHLDEDNDDEDGAALQNFDLIDLVQHLGSNKRGNDFHSNIT